MNKYLIKYNFKNIDCFKKIDESWKAYFLGWAYSDGCIEKNLYRFRINLQEGDKEVLDFFTSKIYSSNRPLLYKKLTNSKNQFVFTISNKSVVADLLKLGLYPNKSLTLKFPSVDQVPENFLKFFVRGLFEGDGYFSVIRKNMGVRVGILGSYILLEKLKGHLFQIGIKSSIVAKGKIGVLQIRERNDVFNFYNYIYSDTEPFVLSRKFEKFSSAYKLRDHCRSSNKTSKYRGICFRPSIKRWISRVSINKKRINLGCFLTEEDAFNARKSFLKENGIQHE